MSFYDIPTTVPRCSVEAPGGVSMTSSSETKIQHQAKHNRQSIMLLTLAACLIFWVFVFVDSGWGPILAPLSSYLHISLVTAGLLYVVWSIGYLPGALIGGAMLDRYGARFVLFIAALIILVGLVLIYLSLLLSSFAPLFALLGIAGLAGIGGGIIDAATNGLISGIFADRRGMALNLFNLLYPLGGVVLALVDAGLLTLFHNDPRPPFLFTICFIGVALLSLLGVPRRYAAEVRDVQPIASNIEVVHDKASFSSLLKVLLPVIAAMTFTSGISSSVRAWTPAYLHVAYGQTPAIAAVLSGFTWALAALGRLGAAVVIVRVGLWRMVMLGILVSLGGLVALLLSPNVFLGTIAIALTSIGLSPIFATLLAIGSERAGRALGAVAGILLFTSGISTVFCGWFFGFLLNSAEPRWAILFCIVFVICGGLLALRLRLSK